MEEEDPSLHPSEWKNNFKEKIQKITSIYLLLFKLIKSVRNKYHPPRQNWEQWVNKEEEHYHYLLLLVMLLTPNVTDVQVEKMIKNILRIIKGPTDLLQHIFFNKSSQNIKKISPTLQKNISTVPTP